MDIDIRVGPLVDRVRCAGAVAEGTLAARSGQRKVLEIALTGVVVRHGTVVGIGDNVDRSLLHNGVLDEGKGGHIARDLVCVRAAEDQHGSSRFLALEHVDWRIAVGAFKSVEPFGKHLHLGNAGSPFGHRQLTRRKKVHARIGHDGHSKHQAEAGRDRILFHFSLLLT